MPFAKKNINLFKCWLEQCTGNSVFLLLVKDTRTQFVWCWSDVN